MTLIKKFQVRIDEELQTKINLIEQLEYAKYNIKIDNTEVQRKILAKGIEKIIEENGGIEKVGRIIQQKIENDIKKIF